MNIPQTATHDNPSKGALPLRSVAPRISPRTGGWRPLAAVRGCDRLRGAMKAIAAQMASRANPDGSNIFVSVEHLAAHSGVSLRHTKKSLSAMRGSVWLEDGWVRARSGQMVRKRRLNLAWLEGNAAAAEPPRPPSWQRKAERRDRLESFAHGYIEGLGGWAAAFERNVTPETIEAEFEAAEREARAKAIALAGLDAGNPDAGDGLLRWEDRVRARLLAGARCYERRRAAPVDAPRAEPKGVSWGHGTPKVKSLLAAIGDADAHAAGPARGRAGEFRENWPPP